MDGAKSTAQYDLNDLMFHLFDGSYQFAHLHEYWTVNNKCLLLILIRYSEYSCMVGIFHTV